MSEYRSKRCGIPLFSGFFGFSPAFPCVFVDNGGGLCYFYDEYIFLHLPCIRTERTDPLETNACQTEYTPAHSRPASAGSHAVGPGHPRPGRLRVGGLCEHRRGACPHRPRHRLCFPPLRRQHGYPALSRPVCEDSLHPEEQRWQQLASDRFYIQWL